MELQILYEDTDIVAVLKPAGVITHPDGVSPEPAVSDWFAEHYPGAVDVGEPQTLKNGVTITRPGVVHRLDRDTSGVLVLAKTPEAHAHLKALFAGREAKKTYLAFVYGVPKERTGVITFPIARSRKDFRLRSAQPHAKGTEREAITEYEVVSDIGTHALVALTPKTGRTHQIRVHLKAIHHPVVCDPLYAPNRPCDLGIPRLGLHAFALELPLQGGGQVRIVAPVPIDLAPALKQFPEHGPFIAS